MIGTKLCLKCKQEKPFSEFNKGKDKYGLHIWCKSCYKQWAHDYYLAHKDNLKEKHAKYYLNNYEKRRVYSREYAHSKHGSAVRKAYQAKNRDKILEQHREYRKNNIEKIRERQRKYYHANKEKVAIWKQRYKNSHKEQLRESSKRYREENKETMRIKALERLHNDPIHQMKERTRNMVKYAFRVNKHNKTSHTKDIVGCGLDYLCKYLFSTWEKNYGKPWNGEPYHIDHIIPLSTAKTKDDIIKLCHYTNLQMLTPEDNMAKSDKIL